MRIDAFVAVCKSLAEIAPEASGERFVTALAERGFQVTPRRKSMPKPKKPKLRVIQGGQ